MSHGSGKLLAYQNNWESDEFSVVDQTHEGKQLGSTRITDLHKVRIHFETYDVTSRSVEIPYNDMGRRYYARSKHYFITERVFGRNIEFDLGEVMRKHNVIVFAEEWSQ